MSINVTLPCEPHALKQIYCNCPDSNSVTTTDKMLSLCCPFSSILDVEIAQCRGIMNSYHSSDTKSPEFVNVPVNQTAFLGSNVTFNRTATGYPKPTITWQKENDSGSLQYNPAAKSLRGDANSTSSQLVITEVKSKDYGTYHCAANNSAGVKNSSATLGSRGISCYVFYSLMGNLSSHDGDAEDNVD